MPRSLSATAESLAGQSAMQSLRFSLSTVASGVDGLLRPVFTGTQGWTLTALNADGDEARVKRQGQRLIDANTDLPWVPIAYRATGPDGMQYLLNAQGQIEKVTLADGVQWLVSDAGITQVAQANATNAARIEFIRNEQGGIDRIVASGTSNNQDTLAYRYDSAGRLILSRAIGTPAESAQQYGYAGDGSLLNLATRDGTVVANFGSAVAWQAVQGVGGVQTASNVNTWTGNLTATPSYLAFNVRESELASTVKVPGATGAVILALSVDGASDTTDVSALGATVLARTYKAPGAGWGGGYVYILRTTEAGLKYIKLSDSEGQALTATLNVAGDLNRDGNINGTDSTAFAAAMQGGDNTADLNGDGIVNATDRQMLYANYGWRANQAPVAEATLPTVKTHTDLYTTKALDGAARDIEGDAFFWRVLGATHGTARLSDDGQSVLFAPEAGYAGAATITLQADDGFAASGAIELAVNVSGARLIAININRLATLGTGQYNLLQVTGDFEDEAGVSLSADYLTFTSTNSAVVQVNADGRVFGADDGYAVVRASARGIEGVNAMSVEVEPLIRYLDENGFEVDVYPKAVNLTLSGHRQLKISLPDVDNINDGVPINISAASAGTEYFVADSTVLTITADGLMRGLTAGTTSVTVTHKGRQHEITVHIQQPDAGTATVKASGAAVQDADGNLLMVAPGALAAGTQVSIQRVPLTEVGIPLPAPELLDSVGAFSLNLEGQNLFLPAQVAINVENSIPNGTEVLFWRKGTIQDTDGSVHETWWLVDNGVVGSDGIARTSSPPYSGITGGDGVFVLTKAKATAATAATGEVKVDVALVNWHAFWIQAAMIAITPSPIMAATALGILATLASPVVGFSYTLEGSFKQSFANDNFSIARVKDTFPAPPAASVFIPQISAMEFDPESRKLTVRGTNFIPPNHSSTNFDLKIWLMPRGEQVIAPSKSGSAPIRGMVWQGYAAKRVGDALEATIPEGVSLSMHHVYLERLAAARTSTGKTTFGFPTDSDPIQAWQLGNDTTLVTSARAIHILRHEQQPLLDSTGAPVKRSDGTVQTILTVQRIAGTITTDERGQPLALFGRYTDQITYSNDGAFAFVAGAGGKIYVLDTQTQRIVHTPTLSGGAAPLRSIVVVDDWLYAIEGSDAGEVAGRLLRVNINPLSDDFLAEIQNIKFEADAKLGFIDMAVSNGSYMALTAPKSAWALRPVNAGQSGNVYIIDLGKIDKNGRVGDKAIATVDASKFKPHSGRAPHYVTAGRADGEFLLSSARDKHEGLITIRAGIDAATGNLTKEVQVSGPISLTPKVSDPDWTRRFFQQNIQRASGNVLAEFNGKQYALVADYNFIFNDVNYPDRLLFKQIGGKIGVVEDPFGKATYLGATTPIVGGAVEHLTLSEDGKLYADVFLEEPSGAMRKALFVWEAAAVIASAVKARADKRPLTEPIDGRVDVRDQRLKPIEEARPIRLNGPVNGQDFGWIYGIGRYQIPARAHSLNPVPIGIPLVANKDDYVPPVADNSYTRELGITDKQVEAQIAAGETGALSAFKYYGKVVLYNTWNFFSAGFVGRQGTRLEQVAAGEINEQQLWTATAVDSVFSVAAAATLARGITVGSKATTVWGAAKTNAKYDIAFNIVQKGGNITEYVTTGVNSTNAALTRDYAASTITQIGSQAAIAAALPFGMLAVGKAGSAGYRAVKVMWNSPSSTIPLLYRVAEPVLRASNVRYLGTLADSVGTRVIANHGGVLKTPSGVQIALPAQGSLTLRSAQKWLLKNADQIPKLSWSIPQRLYVNRRSRRCS
jgi:hypothetical protein